MSGLFARAQREDVHHRPLALVGLVLLHRHFGGDLDPVPVLQGIQPVASGDEPQELHVVLTADHGEAAGAVDAGVLLGVAHEKLHADLLPRPAVRVVHHVHIPHAEIVVRYVDDVLGQVEGANGIVGANGPIACGAALTIKMKNIPNRVCAAFFGDGASNEGAILESMNLAAAWDLPVMFILTNNTYGMSTPLDHVVKNKDLKQRAAAFGFKAYECDGNDVLAVYETVKEAREHVVAGNGPVLVVEHTYRTSGHSKSDGNLYRTKEEIKYWADRNPIVRFRQFLTENKIFTDKEIDAMQETADQAIADAIEYAKAQPQPEVADLEADVYAE